MPKRLLDLSFTEMDDDIKLIECAGLPPRGYVALSYCWGTEAETKQLKTTTSNLDAHKRRIAYSSLPKTIRDAALLARCLDMQYLWVDALCMVQDDMDEMLVELSRMADVYENAQGTVAAAGARHCDDGFLNEPLEAVAREPDADWFDVTLWLNPATSSPCPVKVSQLGGFPVKADWRTETRWIRSEALHKRGWAFQEIRLSRRILIYSSVQPYWLCQREGLSCSRPNLDEYLYETGLADILGRFNRVPMEGPAAMMINLDNNNNNNSGSGGDGQGVGRGGRDWPWMWEVENYSRRALSDLKDKARAINEVRIRLRPGIPYAAGLFMDTLPLDLLWRGTLGAGREKPKLPEFPTWSWMSFNGSVTYPVAEFTQRTVRVSTDLMLASWPEKIDEYGIVDVTQKKGLKLQGLVKEVMIPHINVDEPWRDERGQEFNCFDINTGSNRTKFHKRLDDDEEMYQMGKVIFDQYSLQLKDYRPFVGEKVTKLTCLLVAEAGNEAELPIKKLVGGDVEHWVTYPGPKGYTAFGLILAPIPKKPAKYRRVGLFHGTDTSSRFFKDAVLDDFDLV
ncbi:heterokaryon incompatibility protein-domain-containing protein [Podospora didyma]|uniref:Heterokaryon incompatibility protein-domain-containing protein n=1 Tax=Podospora didyma TaxID=330526 RepID=A0AAE0N928_9PEZI|nr:heterokaryon incompatibility protein-domain-containing protein [Podospora didyma]